MPPQPPLPWAGVRDASVFGPVAPQIDIRENAGPLIGKWLDLLYPGYGNPIEARPMDEACLVLNIWTPDVDSSKRPVMVWLHGGGFQSGASSETAFHAEGLSSRQDVVVVSVNHRLGILGYLGIDSPGFENAGIAGMLDIVQALQWVRDNIAAFGGDPRNVTLFGQSGGGAKVSTLMAMPKAAGLFHKAIIQSGPGLRVVDAEAGHRLARQVLAAFGLSSKQAHRLREVPAEELTAYGSTLARPGGRFGSRRGAALRVAPVITEPDLPVHPFDPAPAPTSAGIPLLIGTTADEAMSFRLGDPSFTTELSLAQAQESLSDIFGGEAHKIVDAYAGSYPRMPPYRLQARILTDNSMRLQSLHLAERHRLEGNPVYLYRFVYETPALGGILGSCHSLELPFVFGTVDRVPLSGGQPERFEVSGKMGSAWATFARSGVPAIPGAGPWPTFEVASRPAMEIGTDCGVVANSDAALLSLLESLEEG